MDGYYEDEDNEDDDEVIEDEDEDEDEEFFIYDPDTKTYSRNNNLNIIISDLGVNPGFAEFDIDAFSWMLANSDVNYTKSELELLRKRGEIEYTMHRLIKLGLADLVIDENGTIGIKYKK